MKRLRTPQRLVEDGLITDQGNGISAAVADVDEMRSPLVVEVLCKLPEQEYQTVKDQRIWFFAPRPGVNGWNGRIPSNKSQMIYLAPHLEQCERMDCMLMVAHEVMHSLLGHTDSACTLEELENEAWSKVIQLGFGTEEAVRDLRSQTEGRC
jgi:hypothetical protein